MRSVSTYSMYILCRLEGKKWPNFGRPYWTVIRDWTCNLRVWPLLLCTELQISVDIRAAARILCILRIVQENLHQTTINSWFFSSEWFFWPLIFGIWQNANMSVVLPTAWKFGQITQNNPNFNSQDKKIFGRVSYFPK